MPHANALSRVSVVWSIEESEVDLNIQFGQSRDKKYKRIEEKVRI